MDGDNLYDPCAWFGAVVAGSLLLFHFCTLLSKVMLQTTPCLDVDVQVLTEMAVLYFGGYFFFVGPRKMMQNRAVVGHLIFPRACRQNERWKVLFF